MRSTNYSRKKRVSRKSLRRVSRKTLRGGRKSSRRKSSRRKSLRQRVRKSLRRKSLRGGSEDFRPYIEVKVLKNFLAGDEAEDGDVVSDEIAVEEDEVVQVIISYTDGWSLVKKKDNTPGKQIGIVPTDYLSFDTSKLPTLIVDTTVRRSALGTGGHGSKEATSV